MCAEEVGIEEWNEQEDEYAFVYINPEKDWKKVLVKCLVINDKFLVDALPEGAPEPLHLEIKYVLSAFSIGFFFFFFSLIFLVNIQLRIWVVKFQS